MQDVQLKLIVRNKRILSYGLKTKIILDLGF
jgi:hypothetical protein